MKRANFTLFQPQTWMSKLGQATLAVLFVWCCMGIQTASAQLSPDTVRIGKDYAFPADKSFTKIAFADDDADHGNYLDTSARTDTTEICPSDGWHYVKVSFNGTFDVAEGDTLFSFDASRDSLSATLATTKRDTATGTGISQAFGGWIDADCNPTVNPEGCFTFIFKTNGDNFKGSGWTAWAENVDRELAMGDVAASLHQRVLTCGESYAVLDVPVPAVSDCNGVLKTESDSLIIRIRDSKGGLCLVDTLSNDGGDLMLTDTFALGFYTVEYIILADTVASKRKESTITVQAPNLVCNDDVRIPFGSACQIAVTPDMILEDPCDTIANDTMNYVINIYIGNETISGTAAKPPVLTSDVIRANDVSLCGGTARVEIIRTFGDVWNQNGSDVCNNGAQTQACSTTMEFEDRSAPIFVGHTITKDTLVLCVADLDALKADFEEKAPFAIDNCLDSIKATVEITGDTDFTNTCQEEREIIVQYTAVDSCGNDATTADTVIILRPGLDRIVDAQTGIEFECGSDEDSDSAPRLLQGEIKDGVFTASSDTITLNKTTYECGYILTSRDVTIPAPGCGKKVYRYWSVLDWCNPNTPPSPVDTQFINYKDNTAPVFDASNYSTLETAKAIGLGAFDCSTDEGIPTRTATDACLDGAVPTTIIAVIPSNGGEVVDGKYTCGTYEIQYRAEDDCDNAATASVFFTVADVTPPSAICTDELIVSVGNGRDGDTYGLVRIRPQDLNAGSFDACEQEDLIYHIKRATDPESAWDNYVDLSCDDKGGVEVQLRVIAPKGQDTVTCWSNIIIEDKIAPICNELDDMSRPCTMFHPDQYGESGPLVEGSELANFYNDNFGNPFDGCSDNCGVLPTQTQSISVTKDDCGKITIVRSYGVTDWAGLNSPTYKQTITVNPVTDFTLEFPADDAVKCSDDDQSIVAAWDLDQILTKNDGCDIFALEVTEREFTVEGDFCKKIERTYEVINWCTYVAGDPAQTVDHNEDGATLEDEDATSGRFVYTQIIKYSADIAPEVVIADVDMCINNDCSATKIFSASAENCLGSSLTDFTYNLTEVVGNERTVIATNEPGSTFDHVVRPGVDYEVEFWGFDDCGNSDGAIRTFSFVDCKRPTPYVLNGLAVEIMQTKEIAVWASDLDRGSFDNCTPADKLDIRMALGTPDEGPGKDADASVIRELGTAVTFNCDLLGTTQFVSIYVIDEADNWDVVGTYVFVQDNLGVCGSDAMAGRVAGKVTNAFGENVEQVNVSVNGGDNAMATNATGEFAFNLPLEGDYTITPEKNINPLNGVSTFDLVLISKHILGLQTFDSPYKYIAADVNKSGSITAFDMVQLRQLILNVTSEFPNNTSWRFVDAKHEFTSENPAAENFDEFMSINNLDGQMTDVNFIAAKVGDVNGTATANSLLGAESRNVNGTLNLNATDRLVEAGQTVTVDFTSADIANAQGYQFTMDFAGLDLVELKEGVAKAANFNTNLSDRGVLTTSWNGEATANDILFSLTFTANTSGLLSELVSVNSELTVAEAYNNAGELLNVALDFNANATAAAFGLEQNTPNPFNGETVIGFNLPQAGVATLTVMDVQGKVLTTIDTDGIKGYNQVTINAKSLSATGVLYYQLESADNIATKKMIIID